MKDTNNTEDCWQQYCYDLWRVSQGMDIVLDDKLECVECVEELTDSR